MDMINEAEEHLFLDDSKHEIPEIPRKYQNKKGI